MSVTINGETRLWDQRRTISELLAELNLHPVRVAVERNEELVPRSRFAETAIGPGDRIEIVTFVGGGAS